MTELFISAFITFFVIIDPPGCAPIYASLTREASAAQRRNMAFRAVIVAASILVVFAMFGEQLLGALGISLASFRIAGGIMLFIFALEMVFEKRTERRENRAQEIIDHPEIEDVSIFPMAMPMIAGPGTIAAVMLTMAENEGLQSSLIIMGALALVLILTLAGLLLAGPLMKFLGGNVEAVITRLLGVLLGALAVQFIVDGLKASF